MSQPPVNAYPPVVLKANMRQGTQDYRGMSFWQTLRDAAAYIDAITSITVARLDGTEMGAEDLRVTPSGNASVIDPWATVDARYSGGPSVVNWWQGVGLIATTENVGYLLTITFTTTTGEQLSFDAIQIVTTTLG